MRNGRIFTRFQKILKSISIFILLAIPLSGFAQYDYEHYVPPFYCSSQVGKQEVFLSTNSEKDINVYIEDGQGNKIAGPFTVNRNHSETYVFKTPSGKSYSKHSVYYYPDGCSYSYGIIGPKELNKPLDGHGLRIFSYDGPFFANIRHGYSNRGEGEALTHGFSLSAKGAYAKGKEFYSGHLYGHTILNGDPLDYYYYKDTRPIRSHSISVMAVEDGVTTVTFSGIKCKYITKYEGGKVVLKSITPNETITVDLNKGQTYTVGTNLHSNKFGSESIEVRNGMNGTHITSTKDIVVNSGSWTAGAKPSQDIGFDQIVPVDQVRDKYIVMKGQGRAEPDPTAYHAGQERTIVVATQANTEIWVNDKLKGTLANPGDFIILDDIVNPDDIPTLFINSKGKDVYVYQTMCGTNEDWINIGLNFIPPLTALGMKEVVIPKAKQITSGDYISPTVTVLAQKNVNVKHNGTTLNDPKDILGSTEWVYYTVSGISGDSRFTGDKAINVAWTASSNTLGAAGYYSGFTKAVSPIHPELDIETDLSLICESYDDDIIVSIKDNTGRDPDFYEWYKEVVNSAGETEWEGPNFINSSLKIPAPNENTTWQVRAYYRDPSLEILFNGDFLDGYNGFDSYYELVTNNLVDPGQFAITGRPKDENPLLNDFNPVGGWKMLLAYSKNQNDTIYRSAKMEVESKFNYIFKMHGRLAKSDAADIQSLKVLINNETIVENFRIDRSDQWQSVSALWRPNGARNASIKILNNNLNGEGTFFAIDSISFVQAVEDTDLFEAKVIPNYSYSNNGKTFQFCEGVQNSLDVSNGDTSWYSYSWSKKDATGNYIDLDDVAGEFSGTKTHELIFLNPKQDDEGDYRCRISFKEEYKNCGTSSDDVHVDLSVLVDEPATVSIDPDKTNFCFGTSANLNALVTGDAGQVKWYVNGGDDPVSLENPFVFSGYDAGTYRVRCEAENGCGLAFDEVTLEVLSAPVLNSLTVNPDLCENKDIILTANATGNGTIVYNWKEGTTDLTEKGSILKFSATMAHRDLTYSVSATSVYTTVDGSVECTGDLTIPIDNLDIYPNVTITDPLEDANLCEGSGNHTFSVLLSQPESFYNFSWQKDGADVDGVAAQKIITPIELSDAGEYKVIVSNRCDSKSSIANLTVVPKMLVNGITASAVGPFCSPTNVTVTFDDNGAVAEYKTKKPDGSEIVITNPYTFEVNTTTQGTWEFIAVPNCVGDNFTHKFTWNLIPDFGAVSMNDVATCIGKDVDFVVDVNDVSSLSELTYEWKDNTNTTIVGENKNFLSLTNVQDADLGQYKCIVTDQCGNSKTATANLSIEKVTTSTTGTAIEKCVGDTDFRIDIAYTGTPIFEWRFNDPLGAVISNADFYEIPSVATSDAGVYYCKVILGCGDIINIERELIVHEHVSIVSPADETIHICQGEQPVLNVEVNGDADIYTVNWTDNSDNPLVGFGDVNQVQLSKHDIPGTYTYKAKVTSLGNCDNLEKKYIVQVHEKPILSTVDNNVNKCAGLVELKITESGEHKGISWWKNGALVTDGNAVATDFVINPAASPDDDGTYVAKVSSDYCGDTQVSIKLDVRNNIVITAQPPAINTVCENDELNLVVTANAGGDEIHYKWYKETEPGTTLSDQPTYNISNVDLTQAGTYKVELYNDLGCGNQTLSFDVVVNKNPTVTNPSDKIICETESSVDFTVTGDAQGGANYQWYNSAGEIVGATSATYTETTLVDGETYYCEVTGKVGSCGTATSEKATLTIIKEVAVTNPLDITIADGADAKFSVTASGEPKYSYQWQVLDGTWKDIDDVDKYSGTQTSELKITNADKATYNGKQYRCVVVSDGTVCSSSAISAKATLTITSVVKIASHPSNAVSCDGGDVDLTIEGYFDALNYTWEFNDGSGFKPAVGEHGMTSTKTGKTSTLTIPTVNTGMNTWKFRCLVSDGSSTNEYSNLVSIRVLEDIAVTTASEDFTPCLNSPFSISIAATGDDIKYKWYKDNVEIVGATNSTYNFGNITLADEAEYKCEIYNDQHCNDITRIFNVDVLEPATVSDPLAVVMCETDANPVFTVVAGGDDTPLTYQWYNTGGAITGATNASYTETTPVDGESYYCEVKNTCATVQSKRASLTVVKNLATTNPIDLTIADGADATFKVTASGEPNYSYQWEENKGSGWNPIVDGVKYSGAKTSELKITNALKDDFNGNQYRCVVSTDGNGAVVCIANVTSGAATLTINTVVKIAVQANDAEVCFGEDAKLSVEGTSDALTFTWEYNNGSGTWSNADGVLGMSAVKAGAVSTLTVPGNDLNINNWTFRCLVSDGLSTNEYSRDAKVRVLEDIAVTAGTLNHVLCENDALAMSVTATAGDDIQYRWYKDSAPGTILSTNSTYGIGNVVLADEGNYTCEIYNVQGCNDQTVNFTVDVREHVTVSDPASNIMCESDADPVFTVTASGDGPFEYQWYNSAGAIAGAINASYTETAPVDGESYYCEVKNSCGTVQSKVASLTVVKMLSTTDPGDLTIADGANATFSVTASGEPNYSYQWQEDSGAGFIDIPEGGKYSGTKTAELKITNADKATFDGYKYQCIVSTSGTVCVSNVTSGIATLTIEAVDKILNQPTNIEVCFNDKVELSVEGKVAGLTYEWMYHKGTLPFVPIDATMITSIDDTNKISTLSFDANDLDINNWKFKCIVSAATGSPEESTEVSVRVLEDIAVTTASEDFTPCLNSPFSISIAATGDDIKYKWYKDNVEIVGATNSTYNFGNITLADEAEYKCEIYNDQHCNDITRIFNVDVLEPATVSDPLAVVMCETDANPVFTVVAGGDDTPLTYQWYNTGRAITGATNASYTETTPVDGESYYCEVKNTCATVQSKRASLTVVKNLATTNPIDLTIADGADATFKVTASGEPNYSYQWEENKGSGWNSIVDGVKYSGATTSELKITNALKDDFNGNQYRCVVSTDGNGAVVCIANVTSGAATLTINTVVKIAVQANDAEVCFGEDAKLSVEGTSDALTFTWEYNNGSGTWSNADGVLGMSAVKAGAVSTLTVPGNDLNINNWTFRCLVSDGLSTNEYSRDAKVRVLEDIAVTAGTLNHVLCENDALAMSVTATAGDDIQYRWYKDSAPGTILSTNSTYGIGNVVLADEGNYTCEIYNVQGCNDQTVNFTVDVREHVTVSDPASNIMCESDADPVFTVTASGDGPFEYQWYNSAGAIAGAINASYTETAPVDGESYYCEVKNSCGTVQSKVASLTVRNEVAFTDQPINITIVDGDDAEFTVAVSGFEPITYQWQEDSGTGFTNILDGGKYSGATSATLNIADVNIPFSGNKYQCVINNVCNNATSNIATLTVNALIKIFTQPTNLQACLGDAIDFEITGTQSTGLTYIWEYNDGSGYKNADGVSGMSNVATANGAKLHISNVTSPMNSWTFRCIVKDGSSADDISNEVKVEVYEPVVFTDIDNQALCFDESKQITLDVTAGTTPLTYSWTKDAIEVSTTAIVNIGTGDNGNYEVTVSNGVCPDASDDFTVVHRSQLSLKAWTNSSEFCVGSVETLSVSVESFDPALTLSYKWFKDDAEIPGATNANYSFTPADKSESGQYKVEVFDGCSTESVSGYVNVYEPVATVNKWLDPDAICIGSELNLEVVVTGDVKSYTWTHNGNPITATTNYLVAAVTDADAGSYQCIVEDHCGKTYTYTSDITIMDAPSIDGDGIEKLIAVCEGDPLVLGTISVTGSYDDIKWTLNDGSTNTVAGVQLNLGDATTAMEGNYKVEVSNKCGTDISVGTQVVHPKPTLDPIVAQVVCENEDVVFRAKATGRDLNYQWKIDGITQPSSIATLLISGVEVLPEDAFTPKVYTVECIVTDDNGCGGSLSETTQLTVNPSTIILTTLKNVVRFVGQDYTMTVDATGHNLTYTWTHVKDGVTTTLSEKTNSLKLTNIQLADEGYYTCEIEGTCASRLATGKLTVKEPVVITDGLVSLEEKCVGEPLSLSIDATGQISSVKWFKDGLEIPGETKLTLYIAELKASDAGVYTCKIEGEGAPVDGIVEKTTVRVYENTTLLAALGTKTICEGEELEWIPNVKGAANIKYKWLFGGIEVSDQKILNYNPTQLAHEGNYEVQVTGLCGNVTTTGSLEVTELPVIITVSDNVETCENTSLVEFSVSATGEELKYQWRKDGVNMPGKTSPVLSLTSIQLDDEANYTCKVYNSCAETISDEMTLMVIPQLRILSEMADIEVCSGEEVTLTTDVEGNDVTYQWKLNGIDLTGEKASVLNLGQTSPDDSGYYTCIVSDRCTDKRSTKPTELTVHELPNSRILGRMTLCAKEDRVTYTTDAMPEIEYGWGVEGGLFAGPDKGLRTRITWGELANGELSIMITDVATGCESKVDSLVTLHALPDVNLALVDPVRGVCNPSEPLSGGYPKGGIYWVDDISEEVFDPSEKGAGTYFVHYSYTDEYGCSNVTSKTTLQVDPLPTVNITDDTTIGSCKPFKLSAETDEGNIQWSPAADLDDANSMTPTFTPGKSQVLVATVMDEHGCTNMDLVELTVAPLPIVTTISDTTVGQCNQLQLLTDIVGDAGEIIWTNPDHLDDPNTRSPRIVNAPEGTYTYKISVTDLYGCDAEGEVIVNMVADPELEEDKFACEGEKFEVNIAGMENPVWEDGYTDIDRTIDQPGKYLLTVENKYACGDEQNFVINPTPKPDLRNNLIFSGPREIELVKDRPVTIFEGQTVTLAPNLPLEYSPYYFEWEDGNEGSILQRYEVSETGKYKLTVKDNLGCIAKDSVNVEVKPVGIESPNAFTPNSSNDNDKFYLKDINYDIDQFEMYVYNRWGELLYKTDEVGRNGGWDGKYKGKLCPAGAYVWMVFINGELTNQGTFMLIR